MTALRAPAYAATAECLALVSWRSTKYLGGLVFIAIYRKTSHGWGLMRLSLGRCKVQLAAQYRISVWNILTRINITDNGNAAGQSRPAQPIKTVSSLVDRVCAPHENRYRATKRPAFDANCNLFQRARQFAAGGCQPSRWSFVGRSSIETVTMRHEQRDPIGSEIRQSRKPALHLGVGGTRPSFGLMRVKASSTDTGKLWSDGYLAVDGTVVVGSPNGSCLEDGLILSR